MRPFDFENSVGFWICTTAHMFRKRLDERLARHGVTGRQWEVLAVLAMHGEMPQKQLAEKLGIEAPALNGLVSRMERDGWLLRTPDARDKRRVLIRPAERAEEVWSASVDYFRELRSVVTEGLGEDELAELKRICDLLQENLQRSDAVFRQRDSAAGDSADAEARRDEAMVDTKVDMDLTARPVSRKSAEPAAR